MSKTLNISDMDSLKKKVSDVQTFGNPGMWKLICKASSEEEGWMRSTKAMEIPGVGCLVQISTQQENSEITGFGRYEDEESEEDITPEDIEAENFDYDEEPETEDGDEETVETTKNGSYALAEALTFVPGVRIVEKMLGDQVVFRALAPIHPQSIWHASNSGAGGVFEADSVETSIDKNSDAYRLFIAMLKTAMNDGFPGDLRIEGQVFATDDIGSLKNIIDHANDPRADDGGDHEVAHGDEPTPVVDHDPKTQADYDEDDETDFIDEEE